MNSINDDDSTLPQTRQCRNHHISAGANVTARSSVTGGRSVSRPTQVAPAASASITGLIGLSTLPYGVDFLSSPHGDVSDAYSLVSP